MVSINFTLLVLVAMFLGFLWAMHRFIFAPLLALMDARNEQIVEDKRFAASTAAEAAALEDQYAGRIALLHREASLRLIRAHRQSQEEHNAQVTAFKAQGEQEIRGLSKTLAAQIQAQQDEVKQLGREVCGFLAAKLELE